MLEPHLVKLARMLARPIAIAAMPRCESPHLALGSRQRSATDRYRPPFALRALCATRVTAERYLHLYSEIPDSADAFEGWSANDRSPVARSCTAGNRRENELLHTCCTEPVRVGKTAMAYSFLE